MLFDFFLLWGNPGAMGSILLHGMIVMHLA